MVSHLIIREAKPSDFDKLYEMGSKEKAFKLSSRTRFYERNYLKKWLKNPEEDILLVAEKENEILGLLFCRIFHGLWAMLDNIMVNSLWRGQGIGTVLFNECLKRLRIKKIHYISGIVKEKNESIKFFQKNGFLRGNKLIWIEKFL